MTSHAWSIGILVALLASTAGVVRAAEEEPRELSLEIWARAGKSQVRTLGLLLPPGDADLALEARIPADLVDATERAVVLAKNLEVEPRRVENGLPGAWVLEFRLGATEEVGRFEGEVRVSGRRGDPPARSDVARVAVSVIVEPVPVVRATNAKLSLGCSLPGSDLPWIGRPVARTGDSSGPRLAVTPVDLVSETPASVLLTAQELSFRGPDGLALPPGSVALDWPGREKGEALTIDPHGAASVPLEVRGRNLRAGTYSGRLRFLVEGAEKTPVDVDVTLDVKHGPLLAVVVLVLGVLATIFLGWWKGGGKQRLDLHREIKGLIAELETGSTLPEVERKEIADEVATIIRLFLRGDLGTAEEKLAATRKQVRAVREGVKAGIARLEGLRQKLAGVPVGVPGREEARQAIERVEKKAGSGKVRSLGDLQREITAIEREIDRLLSSPPMGQADSRDAVGSPTSSARGGDFEPAVGLSLLFAREGAILRRAEAGMSFLLLAFTLVVGFVTLYSASATFGADPKDYIPLFLWAGTAEALRGKAFDLTKLGETFKPKLEEK